MDNVMLIILPLLHQRFMQLFTHNDSDQSALIQKQILKIFHAYTQVCDYTLFMMTEVLEKDYMCLFSTSIG